MLNGMKVNGMRINGRAFNGATVNVGEHQDVGLNGKVIAIDF
jgi:hypothetical protein